MLNFEFYSPTKMFFGEDTHLNVASSIQEFGGSRVLLHYGGGSAVKSGLIGQVTKALADAGIYFTELGGVKPNPRLSLVREGINLCHEHNIDFILAVGGGSVIDSAKAIGLGTAYDGDVWDFFLRKNTPAKTTPMGCILTIASAGSESSNSCVIRNEDEPTKRGLGSDVVRPKFAILNPNLTLGLDKFQVACGVTDILMHTLDRYFANTGEADVTERIAEGLMITIFKHGIINVNDPQNYTSRANMMWAGSLSHNTLTGLGKNFDFSVHAMERGISGRYDTAHPAGLSSVWGSWARYVYKDNIEGFCQYGVNVLGLTLDKDNPEKTALEAISKTEDFFISIGMPIKLSSLITTHTPTEEELDEIAGFATGNDTVAIGTFKKLSKSDVVQILKNSL